MIILEERPTGVPGRRARVNGWRQSVGAAKGSAAIGVLAGDFG